MKAPTPLDFHPDLTKERLTSLASVIVRTRDACAMQRRQDADPPWGSACLAYDRIRVALRRFAKTVEWLDYDQGQGLAFSLRVGQVPMRLSRPDDIKPALPAELVAMTRMEQLAMFENRYVPGVLRIEMDALGSEPVNEVWLRVRGPGDAIVEEWAIYRRDAETARVSNLPLMNAVEVPAVDLEFGDEDVAADSHAG